MSLHGQRVCMLGHLRIEEGSLWPPELLALLFPLPRPSPQTKWCSADSWFCTTKQKKSSIFLSKHTPPGILDPLSSSKWLVMESLAASLAEANIWLHEGSMSCWFQLKEAWDTGPAGDAPQEKISLTLNTALTLLDKKDNCLVSHRSWWLLPGTYFCTPIYPTLNA